MELSASVAPARRNASLIKAASGLLAERGPPPSFHETNAAVKDLVKKRTDHGKKLLTLGTALLIMPDPVSDMAAVPVLIAGKVLQARHAISVKNVYDEMRHSLSQISSACSL